MMESSFRELRLKGNLSQTQVAKVVNVARTTVQTWDQGRRPRRKYLPALAQLFAKDLSEAGTLFRKETIDDRCSCCDGLKVLIERYGARRLYINDAPCQKCGRPRLPFPIGQDHNALCRNCTRASRRIERVTLRCNGYRSYPSVTIPLHGERCEHEKKFLKHTKDHGERYPYVDLEREEYHCRYCAGAVRLLQATEENLRKLWGNNQNFPRIRSVDSLRRLQKKLTNQAVFESKKPDKKIRGKDRPRRIHPAVPERTRKWRREKPPRSLRGLCGRCDTLLFSYKMSRPINFHKECVLEYQREHGAEAGPRNADGTFTRESSKPVELKSRRGAPIKLENLQRNFDWTFRHKLLDEPVRQIAKEDGFAKSTVVDGIESIMKHLPLPERVPAAVRQKIIALRSLALN